jgi:hypothetical protein
MATSSLLPFRPLNGTLSGALVTYLRLGTLDAMPPPRRHLIALAPVAAVLAVAALAVPIAAGTQVPVPSDGLWRGLTDQGRPLRFEVEDHSRVSHVAISIDGPGCSTGTGIGQVATINSGGHFKVRVAFDTGFKLAVRGRFLTATTASGNAIMITDQDSTPPCGAGPTPIHWRAHFQR